MSDIVERLRKHDGSMAHLVDEAAAEIERLRTALREISEKDWDETSNWAVHIARRALADKEG